MKRKEQIMADLLRSKKNSRAQGQQIMMAKEGYSPAQMSSNLPQTMSPNMINQSAGMRPGRTNVGQGRAAALAAQMRQAQANMSGDPAQGKMVSNGRIYVAPTWSEVLADGVKKGLGGYNAGQAREGLIEIDEEQAAEDAMDAEYEAMLLAQQMDREDEEAAQAQLNVDNQAGALKTAAQLKADAIRNRHVIDRKYIPIFNPVTGETRTIRQGDSVPSDFELADAVDSRTVAEAAMMDAMGGPTFDETDKTQDEIDAHYRWEAINEMPAGQQADTWILVQTAKEFQRLIPMGEEMIANGTGYELFAEFLGPAGKMLSPSAMEDVVENAINEAKYTPKQLEFMGGIAQAMADIRKSRTGANVTEIEIALAKLFDPTVGGLSLEERTRRSEQVFKYINSQLEIKGIRGFEYRPYASPPSEETTQKLVMPEKGSPTEEEELDRIIAG